MTRRHNGDAKIMTFLRNQAKPDARELLSLDLSLVEDAASSVDASESCSALKEIIIFNTNCDLVGYYVMLRVKEGTRTHS
jgi:hypothetical protein